MELHILLPFKIFLKISGVRRIVVDTNAGSYGFLPHRLDCVAALVPGILIYETEDGQEHYVAVDEGILTKRDAYVGISVRNAIAGADLGKLRDAVEREFIDLDEKERDVRKAVAKLESEFIQGIKKLRQS
ncbi:F0F1 ATP synthase subunit epsilon [Zobellia galactanivorans]|uniref:ATP synthase, F1 sector epsilon subunit n=1 Tax=Zobellia galactanivorans (strain DSM 12802 / CCUG 47099 / CIP 106680 / NCIMB 13871 / Dsij) TaxID=63186 RepID=G0L2A5_ZOBGA|nr:MULTISPECIES: F0F1 ATP synthase subunit epsilon [Zobellia]MBU3024512.1 F0F1 ATP synthase subunit epsilon [Zobellia galactanivorans]MDO6807615.1 F0F1 ATP synthase subunit epsilon [Zobellia galactanivorans]OWW25426.1 F0F1 ATP synthase subunit epsilon [Zobellia sp. OII3]CAZ98010.1 ATP synthase, F1 sector epsilon subunit [Zobellia galactanivorans]